ncbi:MAG TPA: VacB/RNase II family 3'-5' exoribonuclease [Candidatus Fournierella merdigallinarum]|nr:VacB/RNase II family 3'-5' exoribonuclease [Candidatus Fournierella merdigallinarum]
MSVRSKVLRELEKKPRRLKELKEKLGNDKKVQRAVEELAASGRICQKNGAWFAAKSGLAKNALPCRIVKLGEGFAFASQPEGPDVFIPGRFLAGVMPGDEVLMKLSDAPRVPDSLEGEVLAVTKPRDSFVGTVAQEGGRLWFVPDDCPFLRIQIKKSAVGGAGAGDKVAAELIERGSDYADHRAGVAVRFGSAEKARQCVRALVYAAGRSRQFPDKVKAEARLLAEPGPADFKKRRDLRAEPIFTIDSAETKDIDDAISLSADGEGWRLGVHIADVSHYVRPGTALDKEAMERGTSVYYADSVLPMLPRQLSNGVCSLNEGADRLAFSCLMRLDKQGVVQEFSFEKTVIRSRVKGVYSEVNALLAGSADEALAKKYAPVAPQLPAMERLYRQLEKARAARGCLDIESGEAKLLLDEDGRCIGLEKRQRGLAERMIEEFMLLANQCAARLARRHKLPFVYRIHESPSPEKVQRLQELLRVAGLDARFRGETPTVVELGALLDATRDTPLERAIHMGVLRSMAKARYEPAPMGHFGLALEDYAHFTSPIRRYPDLAIHRILSEYLAGAGADKLTAKYGDFAAEASQRSSAAEASALQLERAAESCYKAEYMAAHLDETFDARVSGVSRAGVFVELDNTVEGLVAAETLSADPELTEGFSLRAGGRRWQLGDAVRVKAVAANVALGRVDFVFAEKAPAAE